LNKVDNDISFSRSRIRSTGVDSTRSWRFSAGSGAGPGVDTFDWNWSRCRSDF